MLCINKRCAAEIPDDSKFCNVCGRNQTPQPPKRRRANGTGTVYKVADHPRKPWVAVKDGVFMGYHKTKSDAEETLNKFVNRSVPERMTMKFSEVYEAWKDEHFREVSPQSVYAYENAYRQCTSLHAKKFRDLRTKDFQKIVDKLIAEGLSRSTTHKLKGLISMLYKWAMREEVAERDFAPFIKLQKQKKKEKQIFSAEDIQKLKSADVCETAKIILMLIFTGMRIGELFALKIADIHAEYCIGGSKTDAGIDRVIPIPSNVRGYFDYFAAHATGELLLSGFVGQHTQDNFRKRDYYPFLEQLGIRRLTPHCTRHTFASLAVAAGVKPEHLQKIMGHTDYTITAEIYVHADKNALIDAVNSIGFED